MIATKRLEALTYTAETETEREMATELLALRAELATAKEQQRETAAARDEAHDRAARHEQDAATACARMRREKAELRAEAASFREAGQSVVAAMLRLGPLPPLSEGDEILELKRRLDASDAGRDMLALLDRTMVSADEAIAAKERAEADATAMRLSLVAIKASAHDDHGSLACAGIAALADAALRLESGDASRAILDRLAKAKAAERDAAGLREALTKAREAIRDYVVAQGPHLYESWRKFLIAKCGLVEDAIGFLSLPDLSASPAPDGGKVEKMRAALEPFAALAPEEWTEHPCIKRCWRVGGPCSIEDGVCVECGMCRRRDDEHIVHRGDLITYGQVRAAKAALDEAKR